jgi:hypothetical protein
LASYLPASSSPWRSGSWSAAPHGTTGTTCTSGHHHNTQNGMTARISHGHTLLMEPRTSLRATGHPQRAGEVVPCTHTRRAMTRLRFDMVRWRST